MIELHSVSAMVVGAAQACGVRRRCEREARMGRALRAAGHTHAQSKGCQSAPARSDARTSRSTTQPHHMSLVSMRKDPTLQAEPAAVATGAPVKRL